MAKLFDKFLFVSLFLAITYAESTDNIYKICVPKSILKECQEFLENPASQLATVKCVTGRDRMDCLEQVKSRHADFLFVDPEDMYVAYKLNNQDFSVFTELRTLVEPEAEFRYEGVILVRKGSSINSLNDLKGKKSCHTGYGRNVGYKIPVTKLRKNNVLKFPKDNALSPVEKELKALSEFFSKACIVGSWSPNTEVNQILKKRYSNLCEMCENPNKCDYPDKYSGYDGAIRCLAENSGDVAFTKTIFVKKYFGLPIGYGNTDPPAKAIGNPDDFEYLCEDGTRKPVTGKPCSWAQRPWQGYMGNGDVNRRLERLQNRIDEFYNKGKNSSNEEGAKKMHIDKKLLTVAKSTPILPGEHLIKAEYKDVIEREGATDQKIRFCVSTDMEMKKCDTMKRAAYSRDIRPQFECILKSKEECYTAIKNNEADVSAVKPADYPIARKADTKAILYEKYDDDDVFVVVVSKNAGDTVIQKGDLKFDQSNLRSENAALYYNFKRNSKRCPDNLATVDNSQIEVVSSKDLHKFKEEDYNLVCPDLSTKNLKKYAACNFEYTLPTAIFSRTSLTSYESDNIVHAFTALSDKFGHNGTIEEVFDMFGEFETGQKNIIFDDNAAKFVTSDNYVPTIDENQYNEIRCNKKL